MKMVLKTQLELSPADVGGVQHKKLAGLVIAGQSFWRGTLMPPNNKLPATTNLDRLHSTKSLILMIQVVSASLYILLLGTSRKEYNVCKCDLKTLYRAKFWLTINGVYIKMNSVT